MQIYIDIRGETYYAKIILEIDTQSKENTYIHMYVFYVLTLYLIIHINCVIGMCQLCRNMEFPVFNFNFKTDRYV